jgi:zinc protease
MTLLVAPVRRLPLCALWIVVDAGAELDPAGFEGCALLTARAVAEGTADYPGIAFTERLERIGAALEAAADWDSAHLSSTMMAERLTEALELVASILLQPAFPEAELRRLFEERLSEIAQMRAEPRGLANEMFSNVLYQADSRYALPLGGTEASVRALTRAEIVQHHRALYAPERTTIVVAGDVSTDRVRADVERIFGGWTAAAAPLAARRGEESERSAVVHIVDREGAPQSELRVGHVGVARTHRDYFPLVLTNAVLGGLFSSRINLNLREEHGYTYGAHSGFDWRRGAGPFAIRTAVESGVTAAAVSEILKEFRRIREATVTEDELSLARDYLSGVFPVRFETSLAIAAALAHMVIYDLPTDYYDTYRENISSVTPEEILRAAQTHLDPARLAVVAVGAAEAIRGQLEELGLGSATLTSDAGL